MQPNFPLPRKCLDVDRGTILAPSEDESVYGELRTIQRMALGLSYSAWTKECCEYRNLAMRKCWEYNRTPPWEFERRGVLLESVLGEVGADCHIESPIQFDYGFNIRLGPKFYSNFGVVILDEAPVTIGHSVKLGPGVHIYTASHPLSPDQREELVDIARPVTIGNRVWVGGHSTILPGVTIGDGAVVGAGSVVVRDVPPYTLVAGNLIHLRRPHRPGAPREKVRRTLRTKCDFANANAS